MNAPADINPYIGLLICGLITIVAGIELARLINPRDKE